MMLKKISGRIPRPVKAIFCAVCVVILAVAYYISLGCPTFTLEQKFRRAEKTNLIGPSQIVHRLTNGYDEYTDLLVGESEHGVSFFGRWKNGGVAAGGDWKYTFTYVEKTGDITIAVPPSIYGYFWGDLPVNLPVYVFTDAENAARVDISLVIQGTYSYHMNNELITQSYTRGFSSKGEKIGDGIFFMTLSSTDEAGGNALFALSCLASGSTEIEQEHKSIAIPVTLRLYDANDRLIRAETIVINGQ